MLATRLQSQSSAPAEDAIVLQRFPRKNRPGDLLTVPGKRLVTGRVWIQGGGSPKAAGAFGAFAVTL